MTMLAERQGIPIPRPDVVLVTRQDSRQSYTARRATDARTALLRGMGEYLATLSLDVEGGRRVHLRSVAYQWPDAEDDALLPAAFVETEGDGEYQSRGMSGSGAAERTSDGMSYVSHHGYVADVTVTLWATDPAERIALCAMCEDGLSPVEWLPGVRLELPHYHNVRAEYVLIGNGYLDDAIQARRRVRRAKLRLRGRLSVVRVFALPDAQPKFRLDVVEEG